MVVPIRLDASAIPSQFQISNQQSDAQVLKLETGQVLTGKVVSTTQNGSSRFVWSGYAFDLKLPETVAPGTQIQLKVMSTEGSIQLEYIRQGLQSNIASLFNSGVDVSSASHWISDLMQALPVTAINDNQQSSISNNRLDALNFINADKQSSPIDALASTLQQTIEKSGLFYESHQAQWVQGQKPVESLLNEPQAKWSLAAGGVSSTSSERNALGIPVSLVRTIQNQLGVLEHQTIQWQGNILPGVNMGWSLTPMNIDALEDEEYRQKAQNDEEQRPWMTRLNFNLKQLGSVQADIQIYRDYIRWHLAAEKPETQKMLEASQTEWVSALQARGLNASGRVSDLNDEDEDEYE